LAWLIPKAGGIKVVSIDGVVPSTKSVQDHSYSYWRPTFYYTNGEPSGLAKQFLDYTIGSAGQKVVVQVVSFQSSRASSTNKLYENNFLSF